MKYYIIAGEASGDLHGANLILAIKQQDPEAQIRFWGGDNMAAAAHAQPVRHIRQLAIMGFIEVLKHLPTILSNIAFCKSDILSFQPHVVIGIDYPGFNLKIEAWAKKHSIHTVHYISPNLWAWKKNRIKSMRSSIDLLCYILPFEQRFFAANNMPQALYVGHPLLDAVKNYLLSPGINSSHHIIALLPGSRRQELENNLPLMAQLAEHHPEYHFIVAGMSLLGEKIYKKYLPEGGNIEVLYDQTYKLLASAYAAIVCSGTATLEAALFNVPQVVCYRGNPLSYIIARTVVGKRIRYISLVNLIADKTVVTELIQNNFNFKNLQHEFHLITADDSNRIRIFTQYAHLREQLSGSGASHRTAQAIIDLIK